MDLLDDIFAGGASKTVKAGGKFQPKAKPRPVKKGPAVASSSLTSKPTGDTVATDYSEGFKSAKNSQNCDEQSPVLAEPSLGRPLAAETLVPSVGSSLDASMVITDNNEDWKSCFEKSEGENADIYIGLDSFDDLLPHSSGIDPSAAHAAGAEKRQEQLLVPVSSVDGSAHSASNLQSDEVAAGQDPLTFQASVLSVSGSCQMLCWLQETDTYSFLEADILGVTTISGQSRRFQPKPKLQVYRERYDTIIPDLDVGESVPCLPDSQSVHSEMDFVNSEKGHGLPAADVLDFSVRGFDIITESAHDFPVHEDYVVEASLPDADIPENHSEATSQMPEESVPQRPKNKKQKFPASELSAISEENGESRLLRSRRKSVNASRLVDESDEDVIGDGEYVPEHPNDSVTIGNDEEFLVENDSQGKKVQKKSKKTVTKEGKRVRKSKKTAEASDQAANKKPKKFSHSTRQKRRTVDKALLEAPMDEIDYSKVPIKDLILLAEHRERLAKKDAAVSQMPPTTTDQSAGASVSNYDEDETYASDEDGEADDHNKSTMGEDTSSYFNYQTYMDKTPSTRWSKQDTELFYEAVQQFGTDLSLIQQLFPGRTRRQLKLKYKKEERQNPFRLHDVLTNRSKDHSHFERVIEHLKQIEAEELQYADKDESIDLTGEEEMVGNQEICEEAKSEHVEEKEVETVEQDVPNPVKEYDDDEDDFMKWSQYTSEV
ncbi:transcription factor TFIIIB component B'' isoform X2 [Solanum lycopersicum]|uniref:transcription factor TFIIIB component B'' isoform X2 n=1 Tax=Solanum lycopersicum TaxID=4081 RepID=UPI000E1CF550|nr:transcription factor TFIIIB component B'' isoform X2 [Solanum lycopersicum]